MTAELNRTRVKYTYRDGRVAREERKEFECVRLTNTYNRVAFNAGIIDVCVEWDDPMEIGEAVVVQESAGGQVVYAKEWTRKINGHTYYFSYVIPTGRTAIVRVYRHELERLRSMDDVTPVHEYRFQVRELPGLACFSMNLWSMLGF